MNKSPPLLPRFADGTAMPKWGTFPHVRSSQGNAHFFHTMVLLMPSRPITCSPWLLLQDCCAVMATRWELASIVGSYGTYPVNILHSLSQGFAAAWTICRDT